MKVICNKARTCRRNICPAKLSHDHSGPFCYSEDRPCPHNKSAYCVPVSAATNSPVCKQAKKDVNKPIAILTIHGADKLGQSDLLKLYQWTCNLHTIIPTQEITGKIELKYFKETNNGK
jgi:hypothetical protein